MPHSRYGISQVGKQSLRIKYYEIREEKKSKK